ncbi:transposase [Rickettsia endosymbiont of Pantilius tunicatus]|uniref:transposase n=1 Tax=Rickettsia endosymbiont of Pantilius tunicatus TaxID=3066267 RepID=UPI00376F1370
MTKTKIYTSEFKESAVKLATESKRPVIQTAKELGISKNTLYSWIDKYSKQFEESITKADEHLYDELQRLKKELVIITQERDILKKAAAYFAKESL